MTTAEAGPENPAAIVISLRGHLPVDHAREMFEAAGKIVGSYKRLGAS